MNAQFNYRLSRDEYVVGMDALVDRIARQDTGRTRRIVEQLAVVVVVMVAATIAFPAAAIAMWVALLSIAVVQNLLIPRWTRQAGGQTYDPMVAEQEVELTDSGVVARSAIRERSWAWSAVRRVHDLKEAIVLELVGWDMIVLPNRLWIDSDSRNAFLDQLGDRASGAFPTARPGKPALFHTHDLLRVAAIAAGIDVVALVLFTFPVRRTSAPTAGDTAFLFTFGAVFLLGLGLAYLAYRLARPRLEKLHDSAPQTATTLAYALIWAVPAYVFAGYLVER